MNIKLSTGILVCGISFLFNQSHAQNRVYANSQTNGTSGSSCASCTVSNAANAVDDPVANPNTFSTLNVTAAANTGAISQTLVFPSAGYKGDSLVVVIQDPAPGTLPLSAAALGGVTLSTLYNTTSNNDPITVTPPTLKLIDGNTNKYAVIIFPVDSFNALKITMTQKGAQLLTSLNVYHAYHAENDPDKGYDGYKAGKQTFTTSGTLCVLCSVTNPTQVIDEDPNNYSTLNVDLGLNNSYVQQVFDFGEILCAGEPINITIEKPNTLVDLAAIGSSLTISTILDATNHNENFLAYKYTVNILENSNRYVFTMFASADFNKVSVRLNGGLAAVLEKVNLFAVNYKPLKGPEVAGTPLTVCSGESASLTVTASSEGTVEWFDSKSSSTVLGTGLNFVTGVLTKDTILYAQIRRISNNCANPFRTPVPVKVLQRPDSATVDTTGLRICKGEYVTITPGPLGNVFNFYADSNRTIFLGSDTTFKVGPIFKDTTIWVATVANGCESIGITPAVIDVTPLDVDIALASDSMSVCKGESASLSASSGSPGVKFNWYSSMQGGSPIIVGDNFNTPPLDSTTIYYVEGQLDNCVSDRVPVKVKVSTPFSYDTDEASACAGYPVTLSVKNITTNNFEIYWNNEPATTNTTYTVPNAQSGQIPVVVVNKNGLAHCDTLKKLINIIIYQAPDADFAIADTIVKPGDGVLLIDNSVDASNWQWDFGDNSTSTEQNPTHIFTEERTYTIMLVVFNSYGCPDTVTRELRVVKDIKVEIFVPNTFTPNGDNKNDILCVRGTGFKNLLFRLYNQWGELVFESRDKNDCWDGKFNGQEQHIGVYTYYLEAANELTGELIKKQGTVTLVR